MMNETIVSLLTRRKQQYTRLTTVSPAPAVEFFTTYPLLEITNMKFKIKAE